MYLEICQQEKLVKTEKLAHIIINNLNWHTNDKKVMIRKYENSENGEYQPDYDIIKYEDTIR